MSYVPPTTIIRCLHQAAVAGALVIAGTTGAWAVDVDAYTEDWPPYNFEEDGQVKGIATDILRAACAKAKLQCSMALVPWARAYKTAQTQYQAMAYTTARKPDRENEFLWVGPILPRTTWVYLGSANPAAVRDVGDLARLRIGVVRGEAAEKDLLAAGVPVSALVEQPSNADVLRMLRAGAIDAMVETKVGMRWSLKNLGVAPSSMRQAFKLTDEGGYYFAFNLATPASTVARLQTAVDELRANGQITKITRRYLGAP